MHLLHRHQIVAQSNVANALTIEDLAMFATDVIDHAWTTTNNRINGHSQFVANPIATTNARTEINREHLTAAVAEFGTPSAAKMSGLTRIRAASDETLSGQIMVPGQVNRVAPTSNNDRRAGAMTINHSINAIGDVISPSHNGPVHREESMIRPHEDEDSRNARDNATTRARDQIEASGKGQEHRRVIAIDGPAAAGKTTVARALADRLGATYLDTGLLYRAVTLAAVRAGLSAADGPAIAKLADQSRFEIEPPTEPGRAEQIYLNGENVTPLLRTPEIDRVVSEVSSHPEVRSGLLPIQRKIASNNAVVMVGRDITTVVVPDAGVKIFLDASAAERARRRLAERTDQGRSGDFAAMLREIEERDHADSTREVAPLHAGKGVKVVLTDGLSISQVVDQIAQFVEQAWAPFEDRASA